MRSPSRKEKQPEARGQSLEECQHLWEGSKQLLEREKKNLGSAGSAYPRRRFQAWGGVQLGQMLQRARGTTPEKDPTGFLNRRSQEPSEGADYAAPAWGPASCCKKGVAGWSRRAAS